MDRENVFLLSAFCLGAFITFVYDLFRIFRRVVRHNGFFLSLEDLGFWIFCGAEVFLLMYHESNGTLRWFAVLGALAGMLLYRRLIGVFLVKYGALVLGTVFKWAGRAFCLAARPFGFLHRRIKEVTGGLSSRRKRMGAYCKNRLTVFGKMLKMVVKKQ